MTKLIGYRKLKSFELGPKGKISNVELGEASVWLHDYCKNCGEHYRVHLNLCAYLDGHYYTYDWDAYKVVLKEEDAKQIVLKHIGDPPVSMTLSVRDTTGVLTPRFRQLSPPLKSELLQSMEVRA